MPPASHPPSLPHPVAKLLAPGKRPRLLWQRAATLDARTMVVRARADGHVSCIAAGAARKPWEADADEAAGGRHKVEVGDALGLRRAVARMRRVQGGGAAFESACSVLRRRGARVHAAHLRVTVAQQPFFSCACAQHE